MLEKHWEALCLLCFPNDTWYKGSENKRLSHFSWNFPGYKWTLRIILPENDQLEIWGLGMLSNFNVLYESAHLLNMIKR